MITDASQSLIAQNILLEKQQNELMDALGVPEDERSFAKVLEAVKRLMETSQRFRERRSKERRSGTPFLLLERSWNGVHLFSWERERNRRSFVGTGTAIK